MSSDIASRRRRRATGHSTSEVPVSSSETNPRDRDHPVSDAYADSKKGCDNKVYRKICPSGHLVWISCLPVLQSEQGWWDISQRKRKLDMVDRFLITGIAAFSLVCLVCFVPGSLRKLGMTFSRKPVLRRLVTDDEVNRIPLEIPILDFGRWDIDIGGWQYFRHFFIPESRIETMVRYPFYFGGLDFLGAFGEPRYPGSNDTAVAERYLGSMRDTTQRVSISYEHTEELEDVAAKCRRNNWMQDYRPVCNAMHEIDLSFDFNEAHAGLGDHQVFDSFYISHGYWRDVWVVHQRDQDVKSILKKSRWKHKYDAELFFMTLYDALVMERLTKSPRVVDIYGHCGYSVWVEALPYEMEGMIIPGDGFARQEDLHDENELKPKNQYTDEEKLELALTMAESLADLHGFEDGLIVHDDVQLAQWLQARSGQLKLGDFNRAEMPLFDAEKQKYCKYNNGHGYGNYRSPEEYSANDIDEKIDVWSFGNNIYGLLTGLWVFYENTDDDAVQRKITRGEKAFIDDRYRTQSFITKNLVEVMEKCWVFNPDDRIEIFEVVRLLRQTKNEYERLKAGGEINDVSSNK